MKYLPLILLLSACKPEPAVEWGVPADDFRYTKVIPMALDDGTRCAVLMQSYQGVALACDWR